jgi:hypothetical protein
MILPDVLDELWGVLEDIPGLNVPDDGPGVRSGPPSPHVELPEIIYGDAGAGLDRIPDLGLTIVFGPANNPLVYRSALEYVSTTGPRSIPAALLAHEWESCSTLRPGRAEPAAVEQQGGNTQIAYILHIDITGVT